MAKTTKPFQLEDRWFRNLEACTARVTTKQWQHVLLEERDTFIANGRIWRLIAIRVGPGVYELKAKPKL